MSLKALCRPYKVVEVIGPSGYRQLMSHDEYVHKSIEERRSELELLRMGISKPRDHVYLVEHVVRR